MKQVFGSVVASLAFSVMVFPGNFAVVASNKEKLFKLPRPSGVYVISVGVDKYDSPAFSDQQFAVADAVSLAEELTKRARVVDTGERIAQGTEPLLPESYISIGSAKIEKHVLKDAEATWENLSAAFDSVATVINPEDVFVFSFSGIGHHIDNEFVFFPSQAQDYTKKTAGISTSEVQVLIRRIRAKNKLIVLDSCDSTVGYRALESTFIETNEKLRSVLDNNVLFIGSDGQTFEHSSIGHGILTQVVLDGLKGDADADQNGIVTARELKGFLDFGILRYRGLHDVAARTSGVGEDFNLAVTDKNFAERSASLKKKNTEPPPTRAKLAGQPSTVTGRSSRSGDDYALLFANVVYDDRTWNGLKNPLNDVNDIAKELKDRYGFKEVVVEPNRTTDEILAALDKYKHRTFKPDDQLFVYFAGHGTTLKTSERESDSFYVGRDSPAEITRKNQGLFLRTNDLMSAISSITSISHVMTVFDACFAGQIWKPRGLAYDRVAGGFRTERLQTEFGRRIGMSYRVSGHLSELQDDGLIMAKAIMGDKSDILLTSGDRPVNDSFRNDDGSLSKNSPFADLFLERLRAGGNKYGVLTGKAIHDATLQEVVRSGVTPIALHRGDTRGDFVFVEKK